MSTVLSRTDVSRPTALRRNRNYVLLWVGGAVSALGSRASAFAFPLLVLALGGSAGDASLVGAASTIPYLVVPVVAGALIDRVDRRRTLVVADLGRLVALTAVVAGVATGHAPLLLLGAAGFLEGTLAMVHSTAEPVALRRVVPAPQLTDALSGSEGRTRAGFLLGQPLGGVLFGVAYVLPFVFDAFSYVVSILTSLCLRGDFRARPDAAEPSGQNVKAAVREVGTGIRWLWSNPFLRVAVLAIAASNLLFQALNLVVVVRARDNGASAPVIGLIFLAVGIGGVLGAVAAGWASRHVQIRTAVIAINWAWAVLTPLVVLAPDPWLMGALFALMAFCGPLWNVMVAAHQLEITPEALLGRVGGAIGTIAFGALPLGSLLGGALLSLASVTVAAIVLGGLMVLVAAAVHASPAVRSAAGGPSESTPESGDH